MADESYDRLMTPEGELIAIDNAGRLIPILEARSKGRQNFLKVLMSLARHCHIKEKFDGAQAYFEKIHELSDCGHTKAYCLLSIGQAKEGQGDYESAIEWYRKAFPLGPEVGKNVLYFLRNNLGYCLNLFGRHAEALRYCQAAIAIEPRQYNAHKNLGVALEGLGRFDEAAPSYLTACELNPSDTRALQHLKALLGLHEGRNLNSAEMKMEGRAMHQYSSVVKDYLGNPFLEILVDGKKWGEIFKWDENFRFGLLKAKMILSVFDLIEEFVDSQGTRPIHNQSLMRIDPDNEIECKCTTFPRFNRGDIVVNSPYMKIEFRNTRISVGVTKADAILTIEDKIREFVAGWS